MKLLDHTARIALAALLHDLGKLAERARIEAESLDTDRTNYCPKAPADKGGYHTHVHAAYTGAAWVALEDTGHFPDLRRDAAPFRPAEAGQDGLPDSAVNAAAAHHRPESFLQWIVATADRVASGFERDEFDRKYNQSKERENHVRARQITLFEQIGQPEIGEGNLQWRYPLAPLSPQALFPRPANACTPADDAAAREEYLALWEALIAGLRLIPKSHTENLPLWLDHFDSLWLTIAHAIPSATAFGVKPEVSLYDHCKATAALATALWRWHHERGEETAAVREGWGEEKFLLVQGDFFGIQDFIFAEGGKTQKHAHKLLRGRSFQVSLLAECAALKLLEALELPSTSQIINAAGKFLIVAPNTDSARAAVERARRELNAWCLQHTWGEIGVGIATTPASCNDFTSGRFGGLTDRLFAELDDAKHRRFDLCGEGDPVFENFLDRFDNNLDVCRINGKHPADPEASQKRGYALSRLADDQIKIGEALTKRTRALIARSADTLPVLGLDYFGYRIAFVPEEDVSGKYGELAKNGTLARAWDFDAPEENGTLWHGYARRFVNSYVPCFDVGDETTAKKYGRWEDEADFDRAHPIKTLHHIACEDRRLEADDKWLGKIALVTLKGDIDDLGSLFQKGLEKPTFAKMAALSRQIHFFFALWLPWFCEHGKEDGITRYRNTYTVFAGGDDFFLVGPWESTLRLAEAMRAKFGGYVVNETITFSAGLTMSHPKVPVRQLARSAETALDKSKEYKDAKGKPKKNAATLWNTTVGWNDWRTLMNDRRTALEALMARAESHGADFSTGLTYALLQLSDRAASPRPEDALWRSQLHYRLARFFRDRVKGGDEKKTQRERLLSDAIIEIGGALYEHKGAYRLPLSVLLYRQRE